MPVTKNALIRYQVLDKCFRNSYKKYFIEDLTDACIHKLMEIDSTGRGISKRQVQEDIAFMESSDGWGIDLLRLKDGKKVYFRYADPTYSINNMPLNEVEINQLQSAIQILNQFTGMPQFDWVNELLPKLQQGILTESGKKQVISFDSNQYLKGIEHLSVIFNAITYKTVLDISYQDFKSENPYQVVLHPYYLKQYNNRWFLFGLNQANGTPHWNLALDRIVKIETTSLAYMPCTIDWEAYFDDVIGVTVPENGAVESITLHFIGETGKYIVNKPLHGSQKAKWLDHDTLVVTLELIINYELERLLLSYADTLKIISPETLRIKIKAKLEVALGNQLLT